MTGSDMTGSGEDWTVIDGVATAWFATSSLRESAVFLAQIIDVAPGVAADLRSSGVRVRLDTADSTSEVGEAARALGLRPDPAVLQQIAVVIDSTGPEIIRPFWQRVLHHLPAEDGLTDPLQRDPTIRIRPSAEELSLRNRIHLDIVRPAAVVEASGGEGAGPHGVRHADPDGNEVDLVPGDPLDDSGRAADWHAVFSAMVCYRTTTLTQQRDLAVAAATLADDVGFPLLIDVRPGVVVIDSGKDRADADAHGLDLDFLDLATQVQAAARDLEAVSDPALPQFVQVFFDAADVATLREFWARTLGYAHDRRTTITDINDPVRLNPTLVFQQIDTSETQRLRQRNRIHLELAVPESQVKHRVAVAVAAGGRLLDGRDDRTCIADPEGNELVIVNAESRSEHER